MKFPSSCFLHFKKQILLLYGQLLTTGFFKCPFSNLWSIIYCKYLIISMINNLQLISPNTSSHSVFTYNQICASECLYPLFLSNHRHAELTLWEFLFLQDSCYMFGQSLACGIFILEQYQHILAISRAYGYIK